MDLVWAEGGIVKNNDKKGKVFIIAFHVDLDFRLDLGKRGGEAPPTQRRLASGVFVFTKKIEVSSFKYWFVFVMCRPMARLETDCKRASTRLCVAVSLSLSRHRTLTLATDAQTPPQTHSRRRRRRRRRLMLWPLQEWGCRSALRGSDTGAGAARRPRRRGC